MPVQLCSTDSQQADLNEHIIVDVVLNFNNQQVKSFAMIDSGSMANFCDSNFAIKNHLPLCTKANPIEIITVDGSPISSHYGRPVLHNTILLCTGGLHIIA